MTYNVPCVMLKPTLLILILLTLIHVIRQALTHDMAKTVAASLIHTRIDYANSLIHGSTNNKKLQCVQTSVARVVLPNLSQQPATGLLSELHWLPVNSRITFKLACLTYKLLTTGHLLISARYYTITPLHTLYGRLINFSSMCHNSPLNMVKGR